MNSSKIWICPECGHENPLDDKIFHCQRCGYIDPELLAEEAEATREAESESYEGDSDSLEAYHQDLAESEAEDQSEMEDG